MSLAFHDPVGHARALEAELARTRQELADAEAACAHLTAVVAEAAAVMLHDAARHGGRASVKPLRAVADGLGVE